LNIKEIRAFYKKSNNFLKYNQFKELIGIPYLNPQLPRSIKVENNKIDFNLSKKILNFILKFLRFNKNYDSFLNKDYKYLILSHLVSYNHLNYDNDFYFGNLAKKLNKNEVLFVLIDHIGFKKKNIIKKIKGNYIILSKKLNFFLEIKLLLKTSIKLLYYSFFNTNLRLFSLKNILGSIDNQRTSLQIRKIFKNFTFKNFLFTYEGYPYEKLVCLEAQKINKNLRRIGYQFGVIRKFQYSLFSFISRKFDPDVIFTIGNYNKRLLISKFNKRSKIYNFGLLKNNQINVKKKKNLNNKKIKVLVMPEGIINEIKIFIDFCLKNQNKEIEFTFRLHPIYLKNKIVNKEINRNLRNVKVSKNKLEYDIKNNDYLLYRGTGAVFGAINSGLIPIYLYKKDQVTIDPLFEVNKKHIIEYNSDLLDFIKIKKIFKKKELKNEFIKIKKFSQLFYDKPKFIELLNFIKKN
jgi:hypothetical protein